MTEVYEDNTSVRRAVFTLVSGFFGGFVLGLADEWEIPHNAVLGYVLSYAPAVVGASGYGLNGFLRSFHEKKLVDDGEADEDLEKKVNEFNGMYVRTMTATGILVGGAFGGAVTLGAYIAGRGIGSMTK